MLHAVIREHLETCLCEVATRTDGPGLARFVADEFRAFLRCGVLAHGFAPLRCDGCRLITTLVDPRTIRAMLLSRGMPAEAADRAPPAHPARATGDPVPGAPA